jgi:hypothetical protein
MFVRPFIWNPELKFVFTIMPSGYARHNAQNKLSNICIVRKVKMIGGKVLTSSHPDPSESVRDFIR